MSQLIKAFVVNRNLLTTLKATVEFLKKEPRVEVIIYDQGSTYEPLLEYYKTCGVKIITNPANHGPHSVWGLSEFNGEHYIVTDADCLYDTVPDNWLDVMLDVLRKTDTPKVGFSLETADLPDNPIANDAKNWESKYWMVKSEYGWIADVDTTFALYRPHSGFTYTATRLDRPYTITHYPWHLTKTNMTDEWRFYLEHASGVSSWGSKLKTIL